MKHSQTNLNTSEYSLTAQLDIFINFIATHKKSKTAEINFWKNLQIQLQSIILDNTTK